MSGQYIFIDSSHFKQALISHVIRRIKSGPEMRDTIRKAYEFALSHVGQDKDSADIWAEYIQFVKQGEVANATLIAFGVNPAE